MPVFRQAIALDGKDEMAYYSLGNILKDRLDLQGAKEIFSMIENPKTHVYMCGLRGMEPGIDEAMTAAAAAKGLDWSELRPQLKKADRWHVETY